MDNVKSNMATKRNAHAHMDLDLRGKKGLKIELLLDLQTLPNPIRLLEIGTGSGGISSYFGKHRKFRCEVDSVNVNDVRISKDAYNFQLVTGTELPYPNSKFDVVISNHVIEHVGIEAEQLRHWKEIGRVLKPSGIGYLAVPNRWSLIEPHYQLALLSCLPKSLRTAYLRLRKRGSHYDCEPLTLAQIERLLNETGLKGCNKYPEATIITPKIERPHSFLTEIFQKIPLPIIGLFIRINPALIYKLNRNI